MMESAEHEMIRSLGLSVMPQIPGQGYPDANPGHESTESVTWPRVSAKCDYVTAARFEDELRIEVSIAKLGNSSVTHAFDFFLADQVVAQGSLVAVCCRLDRSELDRPELTKVPIPESIREKLKAHLSA